jgi:hypothetical protein
MPAWQVIVMVIWGGVRGRKRGVFGVMLLTSLSWLRCRLPAHGVRMRDSAADDTLLERSGCAATVRQPLVMNLLAPGNCGRGGASREV